MWDNIGLDWLHFSLTALIIMSWGAHRMDRMLIKAQFNLLDIYRKTQEVDKLEIKQLKRKFNDRQNS
jgi:hypothetical protein